MKPEAVPMFLGTVRVDLPCNHLDGVPGPAVVAVPVPIVDPVVPLGGVVGRGGYGAPDTLFSTLLF